MILTREVNYAIKLLIAIGEGCNAKPTSLQQFAKDESISFLFLQRIARKLKNANIILAKKGKIGGYWLAKPRKQITILEVVEAVEGVVGSGSAEKKINFTDPEYLISKEIKELLASKKVSDYEVSAKTKK